MLLRKSMDTRVKPACDDQAGWARHLSPVIAGRIEDANPESRDETRKTISGFRIDAHGASE
jgi:hypothetical protein